MTEERYPPILDAYESYLSERARTEGLGPAVVPHRLRRANRLLEACVRELPQEKLEAIHAAWFREHGCETVIRELKGLIADRPRKRRG